MSSYRTTGIVLKVSDFREKDKQVLLYTKEFGKVSAKLIGAKKITSKLSPSVQVFSCIDFSLVSGRIIDTIIGTVDEEKYGNLKKDFQGFILGQIIIETLDKLSYEGEEVHPEIFSLLLETFHNLNESLYKLSRSELIFIVKSFTLKILSLLGHSPELFKCVFCGKNNFADCKFNVEAGGIVCEKCDNKVKSRLYNLEGQDLKLLQQIVLGNRKDQIAKYGYIFCPDVASGQKIYPHNFSTFEAGLSNLSHISRLITDFLYHIIEKPLKSDRFLYYI